MHAPEVHATGVRASSPAVVWDGVRPPAPPSILVADDDEDILELVALKLRGAGYRTITAANGLDALDLAEKEKPGLMILDVSMPGIDGLTVCHAIHRSAATWDIPVLIVSARARPYDIDLGFAIGADDYLTKPFSPTELLRRVESLLTPQK